MEQLHKNHSCHRSCETARRPISADNGRSRFPFFPVSGRDSSAVLARAARGCTGGSGTVRYSVERCLMMVTVGWVHDESDPCRRTTARNVKPTDTSTELRRYCRARSSRTVNGGVFKSRNQTGNTRMEVESGRGI
jgi:hypothetical protein